MASVALDLQPFRGILVDHLPLFPDSVRDNRSFTCCHTDATDATIATRGLGMGNNGGIRISLDATAPGAIATCVHALHSRCLPTFVDCLLASA